MTQGDGQQDRQLAFAFIVENPNLTLAVRDSRVEYRLPDAAGKALVADYSFIDVLLPGQRLGVANLVFLPSGTPVTHVEVQVTLGSLTPAERAPTFTVTDAAARICSVLALPHSDRYGG